MESVQRAGSVKLEESPAERTFEKNRINCCCCQILGSAGVPPRSPRARSRSRLDQLFVGSVNQSSQEPSTKLGAQRRLQGNVVNLPKCCHLICPRLFFSSWLIQCPKTYFDTFPLHPAALHISCSISVFPRLHACLSFPHWAALHPLSHL